MNRMNPAGYVLITTLLFATPALRAEIGVGSTRADVIAELGAPGSRMAVGEREVMTYVRGSVTLEYGRVTRSGLISQKEWDERESRRRAEIRARAEAAKRETERIAALRQRDREAMTRLLASPEWTSADAGGRLALLDRLTVTNPYADTASLRAATVRRQEREEARREKLAELEQRVAAAEARAGEAEARARLAQNDAANARASADAAQAAVPVVVTRAHIPGRTWHGDFRHRDPNIPCAPGNGVNPALRPHTHNAARPAPPVAIPRIGKSGTAESQKR